MEFRCDNCGAMLKVEHDQTKIKCYHCKRKVKIPEILLSLPEPQIVEIKYIEYDQNKHSLTKVIPWMLSILFHLGIILITLFFIMFTTTNKVKEEEVTRPKFANVSIIPFPMNFDFKLPKGTEEDKTKKKDFFNEKRIDDNIKIEENKKKNEFIIGRSKSIIFGPENKDGKVIFFGGGEDDIGVGHKKGEDKKSGGGANNIVYVIDRSGSMTESFDSVRREMIISIGRLKQHHNFNVILFNKGNNPKVLSPILLSATINSKIRVADFLDETIPEGQTNPIPALEKAFNVLKYSKKDGKLIFLLTDGNFPDNNLVLEKVRYLNKNKDIVINTYLYGNQIDEAEKVLKIIAEENNGIYRFVDRQ